jgi:hypothetical protein
VKTDELINMLSQDSDVRFRFGTIMVSALVAAVLLAGLLFFAAMGARPDFYEALESVRFPLQVRDHPGTVPGCRQPDGADGSSRGADPLLTCRGSGGPHAARLCGAGGTGSGSPGRLGA